MRKIFKWVGFALLAILVLAALNFSKLQRLQRTITLFDQDKIVHNFSNMSDLMFSSSLPASGTPHAWPVSLSPLPQNYMSHGESVKVTDILETLQTTGLVIVKDGAIVYENYYKGTDVDDLRISWSMSKSFVSSLIGVALANGDIDSLDDPVTKYVPALSTSAYNNVPLRDVLNMASGVAFDEDYIEFNSDINKMGRALALGGSLDEFTASIQGINRPSGTAWQYVSIDTHVISMVLRSATGETLQDYFVENLWSKIGAGADASYLEDKDGNAFALGGLNVRTRDYALFGELFRNGGKRGNVQIIPADWVVKSTTASAPLPADGGDLRYGYQWWIPDNADGEFFAVGVYGQYIYVNPKAGIVIAKNATHRTFTLPDANGDGSITVNTRLFRAIAEHYSDWEAPE